MGIQDGLEVSLSVPAVDNRMLKETPVATPGHADHDIYPWAVAPRRLESYVTAPEGQPFAIAITLHPEFDIALGDGVHVTLKFDGGQTVNHHYSIKFEDMDVNEEGMQTKSIPSAVVRSGEGYRTILFSFGQMAAGGDNAPFGYYPAGSLPPEGKIAVTIIRVTHHAYRPQPMSIPAGSNGVQQGDSGNNQMTPIPLANIPSVPMVDEQVLPIDMSLSPSYKYVFRYRSWRVPVMECIRPE